MFTLDNTYKDIVECDVYESVTMLIGTMMHNNESILTLIPERHRDKTWREIGEKVKVPWGMGFPAQEVIDAANLSYEIFDESKWEIRSLWNPGQKPVFDNTKSDVCLFTPVMDTEETRPGVIICPGGAYVTLAMVNEGFGIAKEFMARGYCPYVLRYRRMPNLFPAQQEDLTLALLHVYDNAARDGVDPGNIMITGFSAGGHLCSSKVTMLGEMKERVLGELTEDSLRERYKEIYPMPKKMVLGYAVTTSDTSLMEQLVTDRAELDKYDSYRHVSEGLPRTYAWACEDDPLVPCDNTTQWGEAMDKAGVECRCRLYPTGGHGIAAGYGTSAEGWLEDMFEYMK